jgi:hypothetical protein
MREHTDVKKILQLILIALIALVAVEVRDDLRAATASTRLASGGTLPTKCQLGDAYVKTGSAAGLYLCGAADTWRSNQLQAAATLTNAQIKALPTTPITIVSAPGSGKRIKLIAVTLNASFAAGAYTNVDTNGSDLVIIGDGGDWLVSPLVNDTGASITLLTDFFHAANTVTDLAPVAIYPTGGWNKYNDPPSPTGNLDNHAIQIGMDNGSNLTGGNNANSLTVVLYYVVEAL